MSGDPDDGRIPHARPFIEIAKRVLQQKKFYQRGKYAGLWKAWQELVGESAASRTRICSFARGEVVVEVDSSALLHELNNFMKAMLLEGLQATKGGRDVTALRFRLQNSRSREMGTEHE